MAPKCRSRDYCAVDFVRRGVLGHGLNQMQRQLVIEKIEIEPAFVFPSRPATENVTVKCTRASDDHRPGSRDETVSLRYWVSQRASWQASSTFSQARPPVTRVPVRIRIPSARSAAATSESIRCGRRIADRTGAAVVDEIEFDVAAATVELKLPLALSEVESRGGARRWAGRRRESCRRRCAKTRRTLEAPFVQVVEKEPAHAAGLAAMRK